MLLKTSRTRKYIKKLINKRYNIFFKMLVDRFMKCEYELGDTTNNIRYRIYY